MTIVISGTPDALRVPKEWQEVAERLAKRHGQEYCHAIQACTTIALAAESIRVHHPCDFVDDAVNDMRSSVALIADSMIRIKPEWKEHFHTDLEDLLRVGIKLAMDRILEEEVDQRQTHH